jgi:predicted NBD/HSP70 family sugar kinase
MTRPVRRTLTASRADTPVRQEGLRSLNLGLVFRHIVAAVDPISRTELVQLTSLTKPTVSRIVDDLVQGRLIAEAGPAHGGGAGRPRVGLTLSKEGPAGLGLDIRGDCLAACVVDLTGEVRHLSFSPPRHPGRRPKTVLAELATMARDATAAAASENLTVVGGTLSVPGPVAESSVVKFSPQLGWRDVDAGMLLRAALEELPVTVDNEANLAALGELYASTDDLRDFAYVSGELGVGAGLVLNGQLLRGARGWSGELGHVTVFPNGRACPCGANGCLQTYASVESILGKGGATDHGASPLTTLLARADAGSKTTLAALDTAGTTLGIALSDLVNLLDLDTILLGGNYALLSSWIVDNIRAEIDRRVLSSQWSSIDIRPALLGPDAAVIGAALTVIEQVRQNPASWLASAL